MAYYDFEGYKIFFDVIGEGRPLIMLHGSTGASKMLEEEALFYSKYFKVILLDLIGHGKSERLDQFPTDYWRYNAKIVYGLCKYLNIEKSNLLGTSGGAIVALNVAIDFPEIVDKVIADSFAGECMTREEAYKIKRGRKISKNSGIKTFWEAMHGLDWQKVVDADSHMLVDFSANIENYFYYKLDHIKSPVLLTGSLQDDIIKNIDKKICNAAKKIRNSITVFSSLGSHPLMLSNSEFFRKLALKFLNNEIFS
ncbi:alpha/beta fold hydrolase [Crassaminicella profunda]|uniref:alpha/beta fold hydrolase n=1 Tax=Crassaminicella profunda TaxID=1286698 RepID=UPI001CA65A35|nr:alpha/beta hydrolase [Crassaminicella profunda]QZY55035.1 alpha/beta hydrolase [Crassaminicella profunda]